MSVTIYGLSEIGSDEIRYVGRTAKTPKHRLQRHIWQARTETKVRHRYLSRWIRSVAYEVVIIILETDPVDPREAERRWIKTLREQGARLVNMTAGGEGAPPEGFQLSPEHRAKISAANHRRWADPAARARLAELNRLGVTGIAGRHHSPESRARMSVAQLGIPKGSPSMETRRRMSEAQKRRHTREGVV